MNLPLFLENEESNQHEYQATGRRDYRPNSGGCTQKTDSATTIVDRCRYVGNSTCYAAGNTHPATPGMECRKTQSGNRQTHVPSRHQIAL